MNKKVLTLCAGFLLAGSMLSSVNASMWETDDTYVLNTGKYYVLGITARNGNSGWEASNEKGEYALSVNDKGEFILTTDKDNKAAYWTISTVSGSGLIQYQLKNAKGDIFKYTHAAGTKEEQIIDKFYFLGESGNTAPGDVFNGIYYKVKEGKSTKTYYLKKGQKINATTMAVTFGELTKDGKVVGFDNFEIAEEVIKAADLNVQLKDGFGLLFGPGKDKEYKNLTGAEAFSGKITAEEVKKSGEVVGYYFKRADGKYIVLSDDLIGEANATLDGTSDAIYRGYNFKAVSEHTFDTEVIKDNAIFRVYKSYDFNDTDSLIVTLPYARKIGSLKQGLNIGTDYEGLRVFVASSKNDDFLTTIEYAKANDRLAKQNHNNYKNAQFGALAPYIQFGMNNMVDFKDFAGKVWNITDEQGNVLAPDFDWQDADAFDKFFDPAEQIQLNKPEGHWLSTGAGFVNRESGVKWNFNNNFVMRTTNVPNQYEVYYYQNGYTYSKKVYITEAKNAELGKTEIGYAKFDEAKEALDGKYLTLTNGVTKETVYVGKDADDNVILTKDKANAIEFRIKDLKHNYTDHEGGAGIDTLQHITTYMGLDKDGNVVEAKDTLQFYHYRLYETFSEKYLTYDHKTQKYILTAGSTDNNAHDDFHRYYYGNDSESYDGSISTFVLKEKQNGTYNLISGYKVDYDQCVVENGKHTVIVADDETPFDNDMTAYLYQYDPTYRRMTEKMYGAFQTATLSNMAYIYNYNDNDRFALANVDAPEYMTITGSQDTVKISAKDFTNFFLYEQNQNGTNFLGMNHVGDVKDMKAAILADTAYVRNNTNRPQYLLAVGTDIKPEIPCEIPGHPTLHPDTVYGRFLVNMVDSAKAWTGSDKTNPYIWNKNSYYRLAFIDGYHTGDALTLHTNKADTKIALNNNDDKVCTFAFRYVDEERKGVKIETTYDHNKRGWLKYQNHFAVVTSDYDDADVFYVDNTTTDAPTANEEISAGNVVVAGVNGAVVVKGAEGKNVIVSTILGKVVANEVVSSDNATIAAPAGIVVVSVDGESFKVVVK